MSDDTSTTDNTAVQGQEPATTDATQTTNAQPDSVDALPEFARNLITNLRQENAGLRVKTKEKVDKTKETVAGEFESKLDESNTAHEATKGQLHEASLYLAKLTAVLEAGVPADRVLAVASRVNGTDADTIAKDVVEVKKLFGIVDAVEKQQPRVQATDPTLGKGPSNQQSGDEFTNFMVGLFGEQ